MKFSIVKEKFLEPLADISSIVARKTTKPILSHALLQTSGEHLLLKGTDTEVTLQILLNELDIKEEGAITVPAASNPVFSSGVPLSLPQTKIPPEIVYKAKSSRINGIYSSTSAWATVCTPAPKPNTTANGTKNSSVQNAVILPKW